MEEVPNSPENSPDPFGTLGEAMFTLFRELTGEGWSVLRYNHISAYENGYKSHSSSNNRIPYLMARIGIVPAA